MQTKESLENWYKFLDPWNYQNTPDDLKRKEIILKHIEPCDTILDIGAGEGWITKDLPANEIYAIELSDIAASRFPKNVIRVSEPTAVYDYVLACGVLYPQYNSDQILNWCKTYAKKILICGIEDWLVPYYFGKPEKVVRFTYRTYIQRLELYKNGTLS